MSQALDAKLKDLQIGCSYIQFSVSLCLGGSESLNGTPLGDRKPPPGAGVGEGDFFKR
jgi:hypothetical protein